MAGAVHTQDIQERAVGLRAPDEDRERVARPLRGHLVAGRLASEEFEQRIEAASAARNVEELREAGVRRAMLEVDR
jgi:uncharacterized protein DUF1707